MIETILGTIFGGIISWIIAYVYFKKQEQKSPAPLIRNINEKLQDIYNSAVAKKDTELKRDIKDLARNIKIANNKIFHKLLPLSIDSQGLYEVFKFGDKKNFYKYLNEVIPSIIKFHEKIKGVIQELKELQETTDRLAINNNS